MFKNVFATYLVRLVIIICAAFSGEVENFWLRFLMMFVAFGLFELHDFFTNKRDNDDVPPIANV